MLFRSVIGLASNFSHFRSIYSTILEKWLKLDAKPITGGKFEQPAFLN